jgi:hypothetical protein
MSLVDTTTLLKVADRAAMQYKHLYDAFAQLVVQGNGYYSEIVTETDNQELEITTQGPYYFVDNNLNIDFNIKNGTCLASVVGAMEVHFNVRDIGGNPLQIGGWDGYLNSHNSRVSWYFNRLFHAVKGLWMLAVNVFSETDDVFGTVAIGAGPVVNFVDGVNYGNGAVTNPANGNYFAATQLKVVVGSMGSTGVDLRLSVKDLNDNPALIDVVIPGGSAPGTEILVGTSSNRYLDVMTVGFVPSGSTGTVGDQFTIHNKKERQISL